MAAVLESSYALAGQSHEAPSIAGPGLLQEMPRLLEYRSEADPEAEFIPKTIGGFAFGAMAFGFCLNLGELVCTYGPHAHGKIVDQMLVRFAFMLGITGVSASLLLVGLKVRAEKSQVDLHSRHWLNSICTGSIYALMVWGPWMLIDCHVSLMINRFFAAALWMTLMVYPAIAAKWTIGPAELRHL